MEKGQEIVVDASVVVKWFTQEEDSAKALLLLDKYTNGEINLVAPYLLFYEVINALRYKKGVDAKLLKEWVRDLIDLQLDLIKPDPPFLEMVSEFAVDFDISVYDASYLALAEILKMDFFTDDARLHGKTKDSFRVKLLQGL